MKNKSEFVKNEKNASSSKDSNDQLTLLQVAGWFGVAIATPFFIWVPLGLTDLVPSMIDVFGIVGIRIPAAVTIAGLLLASVGFHKN